MRKPIIAGNWKMFKVREEVLSFVLAVNKNLPSKEVVDTVKEENVETEIYSKMSMMNHKNHHTPFY